MHNKLADIQKPYLDWLTKLFGNLARESIRHNVPAGAIAREYLSNPTRRENFQSYLPSLYSKVNIFWQENKKPIEEEIRRLPGLKARFGGDLGPQVSDNIFQKAGLYFESIIIPDPLIRIMDFPDNTAKIKDYYFLKYCIAHVLLKDFYMADVYPPIAILANDIEKEQNIVNPCTEIAKFDCILLTNDLFGTGYETFSEIEEHYSKFNGVQEAIREIKRPEQLFLDEDTPLDPLAQWNSYIEKMNIDWDMKELSQKYPDAKLLLFLFISRMIQANRVVTGASIYGADPIIAAPVSYHWLNWKNKVNQKLLEKNAPYSSLLILSLTNALLSKDLRWLSNIPIDSLIELRRKGRLSELRTIIKSETEKLDNSKYDELEAVTSQVDYNLASALERHQEEIDSLDKSFRSELSVLGSTFLLSVTGALQPLLFPSAPQWSVITSGIVGTCSVSQIVTNTIEYLHEKKKMGKTPIGILWQAKNK